jgi:hypothetical protein
MPVSTKAGRVSRARYDEQVAARMATDFLRRPGVAFRGAGDKSARHLFNKAQSDRWQQAEEAAAEPLTGQEKSSVGPGGPGDRPDNAGVPGPGERLSRTAVSPLRGAPLLWVWPYRYLS